MGVLERLGEVSREVLWGGLVGGSDGRKGFEGLINGGHGGFREEREERGRRRMSGGGGGFLDIYILYLPSAAADPAGANVSLLRDI